MPALAQERDRVWELVQRKRAIEARDRSAALFTIAHAVIERFRTEKDRRGLLDYEDLIDKTLDLLNNVSAAWVHYKLDRGIHHLLIDEAQDTSPKQWEIVKALVGEFFAGAGAHDRKRTIFAVGDEKQSIFSFQGAAPREFADMRDHFDRLHQQAQLPFTSTEFKHSFRSGENVLGAVDTVFRPPEAHKGLTASPEAPVHEALPQAAPGLVELWNTTKTDERKDVTPWDAPFDTERGSSGNVKLARRIAKHVALWRRQGRLAKDVLVLVRRRGVLFESIIRALKNEGVPVAGADRLVLTEHIAVMDLMVLADALLLPQDDLALATVLKSPLFGLDEDELFRLAWDRKSSLRNVVRKERLDISERLDDLREKSRALTPFAFYAGLLGAEGGRRKLLARLGHEAADALDEFLNLALDYERIETPSLQGFLAWLRSAQAEVKRDMEMARDEVRVMTVHGAKGLEAPIVILADTTTPPQGFHPPRLLKLSDDPAAPLVWATAKVNDVGPMEQARGKALDEARDEYRRLLYVGMTRAIERLIVCGVDGLIKRPDGCWYDLARGALDEHCVLEPADDGDGEVRRYRKTPDIGRAAAADEANRARAAPAAAMAIAKRHRGGAGRTDQAVGLRRRPRGGRAAGAARGSAARDPARQHHAPADAIAAGHSARAPGRSCPPPHRAAEHRLQRDRARGDLGECAQAARRSALRDAVRGRQPRRGSDRRPDGPAHRQRRGRPADGRAGRGPDRRLQDQPRRASGPRRGGQSATKAISASSRSTAPFSPSFTRTAQSVPLWCGRRRRA